MRNVVIAIGALATSACATLPTRGETAATVSSGEYATVGAQVAFDHGCPLEKIRVIRSGPDLAMAAKTIDWDVCGTVRRYKSFSGARGFDTWLDVTSLYPASSLPAPLPAK